MESWTNPVYCKVKEAQMEWTKQVSCKVSEAHLGFTYFARDPIWASITLQETRFIHLQETQFVHDSMNGPKIELISWIIMDYVFYLQITTTLGEYKDIEGKLIG